MRNSLKYTEGLGTPALGTKQVFKALYIKYIRRLDFYFTKTF